MKKVIKIVLFLIVIFISVNKVKANSISNIDMDIYIDSKGTAHITEVWNVSLNQGTEGYKSYKNIGNARITNFKVTDGNTEYQTIDGWDTTKSFNEKAYKAGIHSIDNGIEMCFGISNYGRHSYKLTYDIEGFVAETTDAQMIYWSLLPKELMSNTISASITIYADEEFDDKLDVWGDGGVAYITNGKIHMIKGQLGYPMVILVKFNKGTFNTYNKLDNDFDYYYDMALQSTTSYDEINYPKQSSGFFIIVLIVSIEILLAIALIIPIVIDVKRSELAIYKSGKTYLDFGSLTNTNVHQKDLKLFRDIPCNKDIYKAYWVAMNYNLIKRKTDFLGTIILKWYRDKYINIKNPTVGKILKKEDTTIVFSTPTINSGVDLENELYKYMYEASKDGILESKEFERWCRKNRNKILKWFDKVLDYENEKLVNEGRLIPSTKKILFVTQKTYVVDPIMKEEAIKMQGLKKFFDEFDNMSDKEAIQVMLWQEYLMYAQIFGVAKKVASQFKKLYPDVITDYNYESIIFINTISYSGMSSARSAASSYSSGGGGFSSGGGGGGSFGGGGGGGFR